MYNEIFGSFFSPRHCDLFNPLTYQILSFKSILFHFELSIYKSMISYLCLQTLHISFVFEKVYTN